MRNRIEEIDAHFTHHDLLNLHDMPDLKVAVFRLARAGRLVRLLPGIYTYPEKAQVPRIRMAALHARDPDAVFTGLSAAGLLWGSELLPIAVEAAGRPTLCPGFAVQPRRIGPDWISELPGGIRVTNPALTAVDLIPREGGRFVDRVLRDAGASGAEALAQMWSALHAHPHRPGNNARAHLLALSRALPWSEAERLAHRQLQEAGITGWLANHRVETPVATYHADLAFPLLRLIVELDGFEFHSTRTAFENDRIRQNALVTAGWQVLRFTWSMIETAGWLTDLTRFIDLQPAGYRVLPRG